MYKNIQKDYTKILNEINLIIDEYKNINGDEINRKPSSLDEAKTSTESYYYWIRSKFNEMTQIEKNDFKGSAYFIFLNKIFLWFFVNFTLS